MRSASASCKAFCRAASTVKIRFAPGCAADKTRRPVTVPLRSTLTMLRPFCPRKSVSYACSSPLCPMRASMASPCALASCHCSAVMAPGNPSAWGISAPCCHTRTPRAAKRTAPLCTSPARYSAATVSASAFCKTVSSPAAAVQQKAASCVSTSLPPVRALSCSTVWGSEVPRGAGTCKSTSKTVSSCAKITPLRSRILPRAAYSVTVYCAVASSCAFWA